MHKIMTIYEYSGGWRNFVEIHDTEVRMHSAIPRLQKYIANGFDTVDHHLVIENNIHMVNK
jgi:hypothetical protein